MTLSIFFFNWEPLLLFNKTNWSLVIEKFLYFSLSSVTIWIFSLITKNLINILQKFQLDSPVVNIKEQEIKFIIQYEIQKKNVRI